ncbi:hypothetical protein U27_03328 [Candidatus Vecturithrix granuli]|uniref:Peptidase S41 n=1 Tax=Vecturithrix granuli TaxID=1499967 RepID=A0A081BVL1_VECG1|nr:hypothetical protein U27_03328 [Candidatus Vecturithrix granuli]
MTNRFIFQDNIVGIQKDQVNITKAGPGQVGENIQSFCPDRGIARNNVTVLLDDFYVMNFDAKSNMTYLGAKILAVNGMPMTHVRQHLGKLASCENEICRKGAITYYLQEPSTLQFAGIIRDNEPLTLTVAGLDGTEQTMTISTIATSAVNDVQWTANRSMKTYPVMARKSAWFHSRILSQQKMCYFQCNTFMDQQALQFFLQEMGTEKFEHTFRVDPKTLERQMNFRDFLQHMFDEIHQKHITALIIDLRHNTGRPLPIGFPVSCRA